jgi:hypothetical protein
VRLDFERAGKSVAAYGAAAKGNTLMNYAGVRPDLISYVVDLNPAKQGKYLAATGLRVQSPEELLPKLAADSRIMVMNPNYTDEIKSMSGHAYEYLEVGQ